MPRARTGTVYVHGKAVGVRGRKVPADDGVSHWDIRITLPGGARSRPRCLPVGTSEQAARDKAQRLTQRAAKDGGVLVAEIAPGARTPPKGDTVAEIAAAWLRVLERDPDLAPSTKDRHASSVNRWILPKLGGLTPSTLTTAVLREWIRAHRDAGSSASSIRNAFWTLGRILDDAIAEGWLPEDTRNPCRHPKVLDVLPAAESPDTDAIAHFSLEAAAAVIDAPTTPPERRMRDLLAALTGMREGELAGLTWASLGEEHGVRVLRVTTAFAKVGDDEGKPARRAPKTRHSRRRIPVHAQLSPALDAWRAHGWAGYVGRPPGDDDPILPGPDGNPWRGHAAALLQRDLEAAGQPKAFATGDPFTMHAFRRSFATWLEAAGASAEHVDRLLGQGGGASVRRRHYSAEDLSALARVVSLIRLPLASPAAGPPGESGPTEGPESSAKRQSRGAPGEKSHGSACLAGAGPGLQSHAAPHDPLVSSGDRACPPEPWTGVTTRNLVTDCRADESLTFAPTPRAVIVAALAVAVSDLAAVGDVEGARVAHEALGRLLGTAGAPSTVVDLAAARARRGGPP